MSAFKAEIDGRSSAAMAERDAHPIASTSTAELAPPRAWVLPSWRAGDGAQVVALAEALGWPFEVKRLRRHLFELLVAPPFRASIAGVVPEGSSPLEPPWPDLVLSSGRENEPVAQWIKKRSGGKAKLVHVGRPWGPIARYDLVVASRQYRLPASANVLQNTAPLHGVNADRIAEEAAAWAERLAHLPRPLIAVLVGGSSGPYAFTRRSGERLASAAGALAARRGGSLLVTTSARTPKAGAEALAEGLSCPHVIHRWRRGARDNPYLAFLGAADELIVTADSMSMLAEACATGKRVHLFDLGVGWTSMRASLGLPGEDEPLARPDLGTWLRDFSLRARLYRWLLRYGPKRITRDIRLVHRHLIESGRVSWLGEPLPQRAAAPLGDLDRAVASVRTLMALSIQDATAGTPWPSAPKLVGALP